MYVQLYQQVCGLRPTLSYVLVLLLDAADAAEDVLGILFTVHLEDTHNSQTDGDISSYSIVMAAHFWHLPFQILWGSFIALQASNHATPLPGFKVMAAVAHTSTISGEQTVTTSWWTVAYI